MTLEILYKSLVRSSLEYADVMWDGRWDAERDLLERLQFEAVRIVTGALKGTNRASLLKDTAWVTLNDRRSEHKLFMMYTIVYNLATTFLVELCPEYVGSRTNYI